MVRLLLLLLGLCTVTPSLFAQAPAPPASGAAVSTAAEPSTGSSPKSDLLLFFVRADAADALQLSAFMRTPGYTIFKETGPLVSKTGPVIYALFPTGPSPASATAAADVIKSASSYLAPRGANRLEVAPVIDFGASAAAVPAARSAQASAPAPASTPTSAPAAEASSESIARGDWQFSGERGLLLLFVKTGKDALFTSVLDTLRTALAQSPDARRREQARGWRVMKVTGNGPSGTVVYLSVLDPVVPGVNYAPSSIFAEALDGEALARAYADYSEALSSFNLIDLQQVRP